jgi:hypothetical protein
MWRSLQQQLELDMTSGNWRTASYTVEGGATRQLKSWQEVIEFYNFVKSKADSAEGITHRRVSIRPVDNG